MSEEGRLVMAVRHPETVANLSGRYVGRGESPLTERGQAQVRALARAAEAFGPRIVYTSPLERTLVTARAMAPEGVPIVVVDDLTEIDFGDAEGSTHDELVARGLTVDYTSGGPIVPGGEMRSAFEARVLEAAATIEQGPNPALVVTHGGVFRRLLTHWLALPPQTGWRFAIPNAAIAVVRLYEGGNVLERLTAADADEG